jgi:hypothetical protein
MKGIVAIGIMALFAFVGSPMLAHATTTHRHDQVVTGCLESGGSTGQYKLIGQNGTAWKVKPGEYVDLGSYVGHTVTVAGPETRNHKEHLTVLDVTVESQGCNQ